MADLVSKGRAMISNNTLPFKMNSDGKDSTNCIQFILKVASLDNQDFPFPKIDSLIEKFKKSNQVPEVGNIIAFPSEKIGRGSWEQFVPGCTAIISEVTAGRVTKVIIAHPTIPGIIGEISPGPFLGKPVVYLEIN